MLSFIAIVSGIVYAVQCYKVSGLYIDNTFSNRLADNKQFPAPIEGACFGETDLLSAKIIRETPSSLLLRLTYCNTLMSDKAVLGISVDEDTRSAFGFTPGGTVSGYGFGYVRLEAYRLNKPTSVSNYTIKIYGNKSGRSVASYPFVYEKIWCNVSECED